MGKIVTDDHRISLVDRKVNCLAAKSVVFEFRGFRTSIRVVVIVGCTCLQLAPNKFYITQIYIK